jgi:hypothetical protein
MCAAGPFTVKVNCSPGRILEQPHFLQLIEFVQIVAKKFEEIFEQSQYKNFFLKKVVYYKTPKMLFLSQMNSFRLKLHTV